MSVKSKTTRNNMAKKKKEDTEVVEFDAKTDDFTKNLMKEFEKNDVDATYLSEEALSNVTEWIDTGNYSLNAIMGGSIYKGAPKGRVVGWSGESGVGKTYIISKVMANAQKQGYDAIFIDSENALDRDYAARVGCDVEKIVHISVETIEEVKLIIMKIFDSVMAYNKKLDDHEKSTGNVIPRRKIIIFIDSLGNLSIQKEIDDARKNNTPTDMGTRARSMKSMIRLATNRGAKAGVSVHFTNHIYDNPADMYPSLIKEQSGGKAVKYETSISLQLSQSYNKMADANKNEEVSSLSTKTTGCKIRVLVAKNRFIVGQLETELYLSYKTGLDRYSGLLGLAVSSGFITQTGPTYLLNGEKLGYASSFDNKEFWDKHLEELDAVLQRETALSCDSTDLPTNEELTTENEVNEVNEV